MDGTEVYAFPQIGWNDAWSPRTVANASGGYRLQVLRSNSAAFVRANKNGYFQQCAAAFMPAADVSADISITSAPMLDNLPIIDERRQISGVVYTITEGSKRPLQGVAVGWEVIAGGSVAADTQTDENGRYRLCGLPREAIDGLYASLGRSYLKYVLPGDDAVADFELNP